MNRLTLSIFTAFSLFYIPSFAEDVELSKKEKKALIDIFAGKVEKKEEVKSTEQNEKFNEAVKKKFKEMVRQRDAENEKRMASMSKEERKKFKQDIEKRRAEAKAKLKNMSPEQKAAYFKSLDKRNRKK